MRNLYLVICVFVSGSIFAQAPAAPEKPAASASQEDPHNGDNYLERQTALKGMDTLRSELQKDVRKLGIMVTNYGSQVAGSDAALKKVRDQYEEGSVLYYRQQYVKSREVFNQARSDAMDLYKKFNDMYAKQTDELMIQCAKAVANQETTAAGSGSGNETEWSTQLILNQSKLRTAYGHVVQAQDLNREKRYDDGIDHYRLAKIFGISLLRGLEEDPAKAKAIDDKYKLDLLDASGTRPAHSSPAAPAPAAPTK